jgi:hypothetical protein
VGLISWCRDIRIANFEVQESHFIEAKMAAVLVLIELLAPVLTEEVLQKCVVPVCMLSEPYRV